MLDRKKYYLQVSLNSSLDKARQIIADLPYSDRIIIEAGTPLIKKYGAESISKLVWWWQQKSNLINSTISQQTSNIQPNAFDLITMLMNPENNKFVKKKNLQQQKITTTIKPYIVADLKCMDRGETEAEIAAHAGASAAVVLGSAPTETINCFITTCKKLGIDSMVDMMAINQPIKILRQLKTLPTVVILHRGVDETEDNKSKILPIHQINKIKGSYNTMIAIAGGDKPREIQSAIFNGANIVIVWKDFYTQTSHTTNIANDFLKQIK